MDTPPPRLPADTLGQGERILWSGRPDPLASMAAKAPVALFAIVFLAIALSAAAGALGKGDRTNALFSLPFIGVGLYMLATPLAEYRRARRTVIAITDQRLIVSANDGASVTSIRRSAIRSVERKARGGKLTLRIPRALVSDGDGGQKVDYLDLHGLTDGERAYRLLTGRAD